MEREPELEQDSVSLPDLPAMTLIARQQFDKVKAPNGKTNDRYHEQLLVASEFEVSPPEQHRHHG